MYSQNTHFTLTSFGIYNKFTITTSAQRFTSRSKCLLECSRLTKHIFQGTVRRHAFKQIRIVTANGIFAMLCMYCIVNITYINIFELFIHLKTKINMKVIIKDVVGHHTEEPEDSLKEILIRQI